MGIKAQGLGEVTQFFKQYMRIVNEEMMRTLSFLGEQCVEMTRDREPEDSWFDQTGNLRSSVGYAIYEMGKKKIESEFPIVKQGSEGAKEGKQMLDDLAKMYSQAYVLVVVAAMSYAEYVESMKSKDVLASTELWAASKVDEYLRRTREMVEKRVSRELKF